MIAVSNISLHFGGRTMFDEVSFLINETDKIGLVGRNGAGKSTLLKVLTGLQPLDGGNIMLPKGTVIGYLPQELGYQSQLTVIDEAKKAFEEALTIQAKRDQILIDLETRTDYETDSYMDLINELQEAEHLLEMHDTTNVQEQTERILKGLGFDTLDFTKAMKDLSGGWQMRVELAKILLQKPQLILLDEPTNHLDIDSILWLEKFLKDYNGAIVMVSHDRSFLDNITNRTIEVVSGNVEDYNVAYSDYKILREERRESTINAAKNQQREIAQIERNIDRFRAKASKATFAQSLIKKLDKMERIEVEEDKVFAMNLRFPVAQPSGKLVITADKLSKSFGSKKVIQEQSVEIYRGEKVAFIGKNGMGKTTYSRMMIGDIPFDQGEVTLGHNVTVGYYAQHAADTIDGNDTVLDVVDKVAVGDIRTKLRDLLGCFLFTGDDVYKKVKVLSGGEKSRLALCRLILEPRNFLVLDEPTNHLDLVSKEILKNAVKNFEGTVLVVSHDRDFLSGLTTKLFEFTPEGIKEHLDGIDEFLEKKNVENMRAFEKVEKPVAQKQEAKAEDTSADKDKEAQRVKKQIGQLEQKIEKLEKSIAEYDEQLQNPQQYAILTADTQFFTKYENLKKELETTMAEWERLADSL
ncbi:MAG: ABC-F family ATP-binding cassette domain-containing protein [Chitinophagales bacterium]